MSPVISVIVPVYNTELYLRRCIDSILSQTFTDFELLLIDDGSTDRSGAICDEYAAKDKRVRVFHKENGGVSLARNLGLDEAKGEWIEFVDSDDWVDLSLLEKMYTSGLKGKADIVICDFYMLGNGAKTYYRAVDWISDKVESMQKYIVSVWTVVWNMLVRKELYQNNLLYFMPGYTYCEDFNLAVKLFDKARKIVNVHEPLYFYNQSNPNSAVQNLSEQSMYDEQSMYLDVIEWFKAKGTYEYYITQLCWRILKSKQEWLRSTETYNQFVQLVPESKEYIWSCPYLNLKLKIMGWCLTHHLRFISVCLLFLRNLRMFLSKKKHCLCHR